MLRCYLLLAWLLLAATSPAHSATAFVPDRQHFFESCATLNRYGLAANQTDVVKTGTTPLSDSMKPGIGSIFDAWEKSGDSSKERLAYVLATARRESMETFKPVREAPRCGSEECRERVIGEMLRKRAEASGRAPRSNYAAADAKGNRYYGRGFIQITTLDSYRAAAKRTGLPLVESPDTALDANVAALLLVRGMLEGWHGSRKPLSFYLNERKLDWIETRQCRPRHCLPAPRFRHAACRRPSRSPPPCRRAACRRYGRWSREAVPLCRG